MDLAGDQDFRRKRASFWRWQREFLRDTVTDLESITAAAEEMGDLLAEERVQVRKRRIATGVCYAFTLATIGASMLVTGPLGPVAFGSAGLSVGAFVTQELRTRTQQDEPPPARMFYDVRRDLLGCAANGRPRRDAEAGRRHQLREHAQVQCPRHEPDLLSAA